MKFNDKPQTSWLSTTTSTIHCQLAASIALFSLRLSVWLPVSQSVSLTVFFALLSFHSRLHQLSSTPQPSPVLPSHAYHSLPTLPLSFSLSSVCFFSLSFSAFISYHCVCLFTPGSRFVVSEMWLRIASVIRPQIAAALWLSWLLPLSVGQLYRRYSCKRHKYYAQKVFPGNRCVEFRIAGIIWICSAGFVKASLLGEHFREERVLEREK